MWDILWNNTKWKIMWHNVKLAHPVGINMEMILVYHNVTYNIQHKHIRDIISQCNIHDIISQCTYHTNTYVT